MKILCMSEKVCAVCGETSKQAVYGLARSFVCDQAKLDGVDNSRRYSRGIEICTYCGLAAPDIEEPVPGFPVSRIKSKLNGDEYKQALACRSLCKDIRSNAAIATRWFAYAQVFAKYLSPERAGYIWLNALEELEISTLLKAGETSPNQIPAESQPIEYSRAQAIDYLQKVFNADFSNTVIPNILKPFKRILIGERFSRKSEIVITDDFGLKNKREENRFEVALALCDVLRRNGDFEKCLVIANTALKCTLPDHFKRILNAQIKYCAERDQNPYTIKSALSVECDVKVKNNRTQRNQYVQQELAYG